jgi:hypothetical protein
VGQFGVFDGWENPRMGIRGLWGRFFGAFSAEVSLFSSVTDAVES